MTATLVVGAGVIGLATAVRLAERGQEVVVVDRVGPGAGTSGTSFAWLNANSKVPRSYYELNLAGVAAYRRLRDGNDHLPWLRLTGRVEWADTPESQAAMDATVEEMSALGYRVEAITPSDARRLEPDLAVPDHAEVRIWPDEGHVIPQILVEYLVHRARDLGVTFAFGQPVIGFIRTGGRVVGVTMADGTAIDGRTVICCAGRWTEDLAALVSAHIPMLPPIAGGATLGLLLYVGPAPARLTRLVSTPRVNIRPDLPDGRFVLQATDLDPSVHADASYDPAGAEARDILHRAAAALPALENAPIESLRIGYRAIPADRITVAGWVPDAPGLYVVATHSGYTLALLLGDLVSREVADGMDQDQLAEFRPSRFLNRVGPNA